MADIPDSIEAEVQRYLDEGDGAGDDDDAYKLNPAVPALLRAWRCEKSAPELLFFETELVTELSDMLNAQAASVDAGAHISAAMPSHPSVTALFQMDVARTRFLLTSYLRTRLAKVWDRCGPPIVCACVVHLLAVTSGMDCSN